MKKQTISQKKAWKSFYGLLFNTLFASVTNTFVWFALTFWVFLETQSVLATSLLAGTFAVANAFSAVFFGAIVDHNLKKNVMMFSSAFSLVSFTAGLFLLQAFPGEVFATVSSPMLWLLIVVLLVGVVVGNLRTIALSTTVTLLFPEGERAKANGMVGAVNGAAFAITSVFSGLVIGFLNMWFAMLIACVITMAVLAHLMFVVIPEKKAVWRKGDEPVKRMDFGRTVAIISAVPGLFALIFFTTFNNFLGGVFMALMDAYGLSLVSVQAWGLIFGCLSFAFIAGGLLIAKFGLGRNPLRTLFAINMITWTVCIFFTIQASIVLLIIGLFFWMLLVPFMEASEQTILQKVVPYERQGRVFGFAQSVESAATPFTAFLIGPIAQTVFIPFMTTGAGVGLIGDWFGVGMDRGIALVFICAGIIGLFVTILARNSRSYRLLAPAVEQDVA